MSTLCLGHNQTWSPHRMTLEAWQSELLTTPIRPYAMHGQEVLIYRLPNLHGLRPRLVQWRCAITCTANNADQHI